LHGEYTDGACVRAHDASKERELNLAWQAGEFKPIHVMGLPAKGSNELRLLIYLVLVIGCGCPVGAQSAEPPPIRVGVYQNPPKVTVDAAGQADGFFVAIWKEIARDNGWRTEWVAGEWADLMKALEAGDIDVLVDVASHEERRERMHFNSEVVLSNWSVFYAAKAADPIISLHDLSGHSLAVLKGSIQAREIREVALLLMLELSLMEVETMGEALTAVATGHADYALVNQLAGARIGSEISGLQVCDLVFQPVGLHFAFNHAVDPALVAAVDATLARLKADKSSAYTAARERWIDPWRPGAMVPSFWDRWGPWLLAGALLGLVSFLLFQWLLRQRTRQLREHIVSLKERERELTQARNAAEAANQAKSEFLAVVNHELRTPLNAIIAPAEMLIGECKEPQHLELMQLIRGSALQLLRLITDILDLTRMESGPLVRKSDPIELSEFCAELLGIHRLIAEEKGIGMTLYLAAEAAPVVASDREALRQVLSNLVGNAVKYTERGEVSVHVATHDDGQGAADLEIEVRDCGPGIAEDIRERIFQPFQQADMSARRRYEGIGIGLTIAVRVAQRMGGKVWLKDTSSSGSVFAARLPVGIPQVSPAGAGIL
jgi:signal transduction histidine kinase